MGSKVLITAGWYKVFTPYTEAKVLSFLETDWGVGNADDPQLSFLAGAEDQH